MAPGIIEPVFKLHPSSRCDDILRPQTSNPAVPKDQAVFSTDENSVEAATCKRECTSTLKNNDKNNNGRSFNDFTDDIQDYILAKLEYKQLFRLKAVSKGFKARVESDEFKWNRASLRPREGLLTALHFTVGQDKMWRCAGYDLDTKAWTKLPPFAMLPCLDNKLFKDHSICGDGGLLCVCFRSITTSSSQKVFQQKMVVFNPLTGGWRELPQLNHPRDPVLMHMIVAPTGDSFKVIVAGGARGIDEDFSQTTEVFDSRTSTWTVTEDMPEPVFGLNEHQTGAYKDGLLYCIVFINDEQGRGILSYNVDEGKWLSHLSVPLLHAANFNVMQVANINGEIVVFSEVELIPRNPQRSERTVDQRIDILEKVLDISEEQLAVGQWSNVISKRKVGSQVGLQVYPEHTCIPFGDGKLCLFNTIRHTGLIYDMSTGKCTGSLSPPTWDRGGKVNFYTYNPPTFTFAPSLKSNPALELQLPQGLVKGVSFV